MKNFIEQYREKSVKKALEAESVQGAFPFWIEKIKEFNPNSSTKIINLGSKLREIKFKTSKFSPKKRPLCFPKLSSKSRLVVISESDTT